MTKPTRGLADTQQDLPAAPSDDFAMMIDTVRPDEEGEIVTIRFGSVTVRGRRPPPEELARNLERSKEAMAGLAEALLKPGIELEKKPGVPYFHTDPDDTSRLVRLLDGKKDYVRFIDGKFQVVG